MPAGRNQDDRALPLPENPCTPHLLLYHVLELVTTQAPKEWGLHEMQPPYHMSPCDISLCHNAFHSVKTLPSTWESRAERAVAGTGAGWRASVAGLRVRGSQIWDSLEATQPEQSGEVCLQGSWNALRKWIREKKNEQKLRDMRVGAYCENSVLPTSSR